MEDGECVQILEPSTRSPSGIDFLYPRMDDLMDCLSGENFFPR
jgi:hypothetical protein